jgi:uncharacterized protein YcfL
MKKLIIGVFLIAIAGCSSHNRPELSKTPPKTLDTQTCMNDLNAANSDCAHSVDPSFIGY